MNTAQIFIALVGSIATLLSLAGTSGKAAATFAQCTEDHHFRATRATAAARATSNLLVGVALTLIALGLAELIERIFA